MIMLVSLKICVYVSKTEFDQKLIYFRGLSKIYSYTSIRNNQLKQILMRNLAYLKLGILAVFSLLLMVGCEKSSNQINPNFEGLTKGVKVESFFTQMLPDNYCGPISEFELIGGQTILMGKVQVVRDANYLYVKYLADPGYVIAETHLYIGAIKSLPRNPAGNPVIGSFPYKFEYDGGGIGVESKIHIISLDEIIGDCFDIVAHAVVKCADGSCETLEETTWAKDKTVFSVKARIFDEVGQVIKWMSTQEVTDITAACDFTLGYDFLDLDALPDDFPLFDSHYDSDIPLGSVHIEIVEGKLVFTITGFPPYNLVKLSAVYAGQLHTLVTNMRDDYCFDWANWTNQIEKDLPNHMHVVDMPIPIGELSSVRWGFYIENYCLSSCRPI